MSSLTINDKGEPQLSRSYTLNFIGDWGQANFHRICGWLTQEFCNRAGPESRVATWSIRGGGIEALPLVHEGEAQLAITTPAAFMKKALTGEAIFQSSMPHLRALAVLPQNDKLVLAIDPKFGIRSFEQLRASKLALRIAASTDDGTNFIGYVTSKFMEAHGISKAELESWGGKYVTFQRPDSCLELVDRGEVDAVVQEAIMTPWWSKVVETNKVQPLPAEPAALGKLEQQLGLGMNPLLKGFWSNLETDLPALDFSDFVIVVRDDLPDEVAYLLTWCLVETRNRIEAQYKHIPPEKSPLNYPLDPKKMAKTSLPLHRGAEQYYVKHGHL
ncbi:uncharacterized protein A1O9_04035 [Exophiala aquamarina CBS 119918]|uniref:SsuA/THI5-like domain-containing protein n=1 Tax=Exophiala aquamarina CBS 119918 TaxID=1182545 RepID=A0A072PH59_9EURO|nr:uncharacterized protein A1O9_04035 [Exophiala aquamarina CBS 119918]KEF59191.1 hypothetical protein A1O9_04035 [Exophiala aquamarina CBS 119918]